MALNKRRTITKAEALQHLAADRNEYRKRVLRNVNNKPKRF
jgi:hypothetical protein